MSDVPANPIWSAAAGAATNGGTLAAVSAGAAPGTPPRGVVRTTWLAGSAAPLLIHPDPIGKTAADYLEHTLATATAKYAP